MVNEYNDKLDFKAKIRAMPPEDRIVELADFLWDMKTDCINCQGNSYTKKQSNLTVAVVTGLNTIIAALTARFTGN